MSNSEDVKADKQSCKDVTYYQAYWSWLLNLSLYWFASNACHLEIDPGVKTMLLTSPLRGPPIYVSIQMSRHMGKPTICIGENKGADHLRSNCEADHRLCFRYSDSTIPLLLKSEISSF